MNDIIAAVVIGVVGGSGFVGIFFYFIRRYIEKIIHNRESDNEKKRETQQKKQQVEREIEHATGRLLFWLYKAIVTGTHNGDLNDSFDAFQSAEEKKKQLEREILSESE